MNARTARAWLWYAPALLALGAALLFGSGFVLALRGTLGEPLGSVPPPPRRAEKSVKPGGKRLLLVLGDSLAKGTGDESGRGFAIDLLDALRRRGPADVANLAVNGAESADVRELISGENVRNLAASADWILLSVGGNDLSHAVPRGPGSPVEALEDVGKARARLIANLREILDELRKASRDAPIYLIGLYDPFSEERPIARTGASVILGWNTAVAETALPFPNVFVVPTFDLFYGRPDRLAADHFHPNREGYELIARRIEQLLPS
ncbi:MAG TPA: GDSL-type esterase/lipase family protein [Thermoanaerobaculia bacterium]